MFCELCGKEHNGSYGSGRFCSQKCARSFSTNAKRKEINEKVSKTVREKFKREVGKTKRELRREQSEMCVKKIQKQVADLISSDDYAYLKYITIDKNDIDFNNKYIVNREGKILNAHTLKEIKHTAYENFEEEGHRYRRVVLSDKYNNSHIVCVHRVVASTFIPNPHNYPIINHKDENPLNNCVNNLEWCTHLYNNTYNDIHIRRGITLSNTIKKNGGPWNKGKHIKKK